MKLADCSLGMMIFFDLETPVEVIGRGKDGMICLGTHCRDGDYNFTAPENLTAKIDDEMLAPRRYPYWRWVIGNSECIPVVVNSGQKCKSCEVPLPHYPQQQELQCKMCLVMSEFEI